MARFCTYPQCLKMCCRHIFHKEEEKKMETSTHIQRLDQSFPLLLCSACRADDFHGRRINFSVSQSLTPLRPARPTATGSARFPLRCGKGHHVYILALLSDSGCISALRAPLLFDKDTSKASVSVAAASQEDPVCGSACQP